MACVSSTPADATWRHASLFSCGTQLAKYARGFFGRLRSGPSAPYRDDLGGTMGVPAIAAPRCLFICVTACAPRRSWVASRSCTAHRLLLRWFADGALIDVSAIFPGGDNSWRLLAVLGGLGYRSPQWRWPRRWVRVPRLALRAARTSQVVRNFVESPMCLWLTSNESALSPYDVQG